MRNMAADALLTSLQRKEMGRGGWRSEERWSCCHLEHGWMK